MAPDGRVADTGEILEIEPHRRLVLSWRNELFPEVRDEVLVAFEREDVRFPYVLGVLRNGLILLSISPFWQTTVIGLVIIFAVALDKWTESRRLK